MTRATLLLMLATEAWNAGSSQLVEAMRGVGRGLAVSAEVVVAMSRSESRIGRTVYYSGRVQGVGFRATAHAIAREFQVTGWVKNLPDGRVELYAEGTAGEVTRFQAEIRRTLQRNIQEEVFSDRPPTGKFKRFEITY